MRIQTLGFYLICVQMIQDSALGLFDPNTKRFALWKLYKREGPEKSLDGNLKIDATFVFFCLILLTMEPTWYFSENVSLQNLFFSHWLTHKP